MSMDNLEPEKKTKDLEVPLNQEKIGSGINIDQQNCPNTKIEHIIIKSKTKPYNFIEIDAEEKAKLLEEFKNADVNKVRSFYKILRL